MSVAKGWFLVETGACSFCSTDRGDGRWLAGHTTTNKRICNECSLVIVIVQWEEHARGSKPGLPAWDADVSAGEVDWNDPRIQEVVGFLRSLSPSKPIESTVGLACSFCHRPQTGVDRIVAGPNVYICQSCTGNASHLFSQSQHAL